MKKKNFIAGFAFSLVACIWGLMSCSGSIPSNQIHYTTKDNSILELQYPDNFGEAKIITNTYFPEDSVGIIVFSTDVTEIGESAFQGCSSLTSINIPESVTKIGGWTFEDCSSLTSITIPESVTEIGWGSFKNCSSLTSITIPESVTKIGGYTFENCSSLTSITIPESVTEIGEGAFMGCSSLRNITTTKSVRKIERNVNNGSYSRYSHSDYKKAKEKLNHPSWCIGSWRIKINDVDVMIANIYADEVNIKIMHGFTVADSETLENWTVEDGVLYMYNGTNKNGNYNFKADERRKVLYHNGRAMQKH